MLQNRSAGRAPFSLLVESWLPVRRASGRRDWVQPAQIAEPDIVAFDWGRADFDAASREFMIGLLATACGERLTKWAAWRPTVAELDAAFAPLAGAFVLDGGGPRFMQDLEPLGDEMTPVAQLLIEAPGANTVKRNLDHFVRRGGVRVLSRAAAAMTLFTLQDFAPSGGAGHRTSLRGGGPLSTLVHPGEEDCSLWRLLWLNTVLPRDQGAPADAPVFPWMVPTRESSKGQRTTPVDVAPAQAYWAMPRRVRLEFSANDQGIPCDLTGIVDSVIVTQYVTRPYGANYDGWSHPLSPHYKGKGDVAWLPVHGQPGRIGYRHYVGLVVSASDKARVPAEAVHEARGRLGRRARHRARLDASGYDMDNMKARDFVESAMPVLVLDGEVEKVVLPAIEEFVAAADLARRLLSTRIRAALFSGDPPGDGGPLALSRELFWQQTEPGFWTCIFALADALEAGGIGGEAEALAITRCREDWLVVMRRQCLAIFDRLVPMQDLEILGQSENFRIVRARQFLSLALNGYGKDGAALFKALGMVAPKGKGKAA